MSARAALPPLTDAQVARVAVLLSPYVTAPDPAPRPGTGGDEQ